MKKISYITPGGQVTIPRSIMKSLGIDNGNNILLRVENGLLVLKKIEEGANDNNKNTICMAG